MIEFKHPRARKAAFGAVLSLLLALATPTAQAMTSLKKVQVTDGAQIDFFFDGKVAPGQVKTEFLNDIIQISLEDVSVYPAKIFSVSGMDLTKVFAYQYAPKLVRTRLTVKGKAEDYQARVQIKFNGKTMSVRLADGAGIATAGASGAASASGSAGALSAAADSESAPKAAAVAASANESAKGGSVAKKSAGALSDDPEQQALLERVTQSSAVPARNPKNAAGSAGAANLGGGDRREAGKKSDAPIAGGKPFPSPLRTIGVLAAMLAALAAVAFVFRKLRDQSSERNRKINGFLGKFMGTEFVRGKKAKLIETVATHYLGPKKSISVVRVGNRMLVLGLTPEGINLITQLPAETAAEELPDAIGAALGAALGAPSSGAGAKKKSRGAASGAATAYGSGSAAGFGADFGSNFGDGYGDGHGETDLDRLILGEAGDPAKISDADLGYTEPREPRLSAGANAAGRARFSELLSRQNAGPHAGAANARPAHAAPAPTGPSARDKIRSRMEGMKPL